MVDITILTGVDKTIYDWGSPHCTNHCLVHHEISHSNPAEFRQVRAFFWNDGSVTKRVPEDVPRILVFCCGDLELVDLPSGNFVS